MKRPDRRVVFLTIALVVFFPLYGCMVIAPVSLLSLSMLTTKVPMTWWLILINPLIVVGVLFNFFLAILINFALVSRFATDRSKNVCTVVLIALVTLIPFFFSIYGWAGPSGTGEWGNFLEFYEKAIQ